MVTQQDIRAEAERRGLIPSMEALQAEAKRRGLTVPQQPTAPQPNLAPQMGGTAVEPLGVDPAQFTDRYTMRDILKMEPGRADIARAAKEAGVSLEGAPNLARLLSSFGDDAVQSGLNQFYGQEIQIRGADASPIGRTEFRDPATGQFTAVNPPGPDLGDLAGVAGHGITLAAEVGGGIAGTALGPGAGTIGGAAIGAALGEYARLSIGQKMGVVDPNISEQELAAMAVMNAGLPAAAGGAVTGVVLRIGRKLFTPSAKAIPKTLDPEGVETLATRVDEATELQQKIPDLRYTGAQATRDPELTALEQQARRSPNTARSFEQIDREQSKAFDEFLTESSRKAGADVTGEGDAFVFGQQAKALSEDRLGVIESGAARRVATAEEAAEEATESLLKGSQVAGGETGIQVKGAFRNEQIEFQAKERAKYVEIDDLAAKMKLPPAPIDGFRETASQLGDRIRKNVLSQIDEADRSLVSQALEAGTKRVRPRPSGIVGTGMPKTTTENLPQLSFAQIQGTLQAIRALKRRVQTGLTTGVELGVIRRLERGLLKDRAAFLKDKPQLAAKMEEAEQFVRLEKARLDRSLVGDIMRTRRGREVVTDEGVFKKIIHANNPTEAKKVAEILRRPRTDLTPEVAAEYDAALSGVRSGILELYETRVLKAGKIDIRAHTKFMRDFGETIKPFFGDDIINRAARAKNLQQVVLRQEANRDALLKAVRSKIKTGALADTIRKTNEPIEVFRAVWDRGGPETVRTYINLAKRDPDLINSLKGAVYQDLRQHITSRAGGAPVLDFKKLGSYIDKPGRARQLDVLFGEGYTKNLGLLQKALTRAQTAVGAAPPHGTVAALYDLTRAYVGLFTTPGRVVTAYRKIRGRSAERAIAESLKDGESLGRLLRLSVLPKKSTAAVEIIGGAGAYTLFSEEP